MQNDLKPFFPLCGCCCSGGLTYHAEAIRIGPTHFTATMQLCQHILGLTHVACNSLNLFFASKSTKDNLVPVGAFCNSFVMVRSFPCEIWIDDNRYSLQG